MDIECWTGFLFLFLSAAAEGEGVGEDRLQEGSEG